jgi:hypothetical protein
MDKCSYCYKSFKNINMHLNRNKRCKNMSDTLCLYCHKTANYLDPIFGNRVCNDCQQTHIEYQEPKVDRKQELIQAMNKVGLKVRHDSRLCQKYINYKLDNTWTLDKVVNMCCEMEWLFNYTNYKQLLDEKLYDSKHQHQHQPKEEWRVYFENCDKEVRNEVFENYGKPNKWPWIKD